MSNKEVAKSTIIKDLNPNWELTKNFDIDIQPNVFTEQNYIYIIGNANHSYRSKG